MTRPAVSKQSRSLRLIAGGGAGAARSPRVRDDEILEALQREDAGAGTLLYDHVIGAVEGTLFRMLGRYEPDHEDLVQAAFEQIVITLGKRRFAQACSLKSWAAAVTTNVALNALRRRGVERKIFDHGLDDTALAGTPSPGGDPEHQTGVRSELALLRRVLAHMSPKLARTVVLHDAFGHEVAEVAALTGASVAAAQSRLVRGRRKLAELLASELPEGKR